MIQLKRIYEAASADDGLRILVDRIWPRGVSREGARIDFWMRELAPSTQLRKWFHHDPERWEEFTRRYEKELDADREAALSLVEEIGSRKATLLFAAKDPRRNNAVVLKRYIERLRGQQGPTPR